MKEYKLERVGAFAFSPEGGHARQRWNILIPRSPGSARTWSPRSSPASWTITTNRASARLMQVLCEGYDPDEESYYGRPLPTRRISTERSGSRRKNISRPVTLPTSVWWTPMTVSLSVCWRKNTMTTASKITLVRVVLIPVYMVLMLFVGRWGGVAALGGLWLCSSSPASPTSWTAISPGITIRSATSANSSIRWQISCSLRPA